MAFQRTRGKTPKRSETPKRKKKNKISLFLDSGAFSAFTKNIEIDIYKYIDFIKEHIGIIDIYANLDVIGDAEATWKNQKIMEAEGLTPIPTFHLKEDFSYLDRYIKNYNYIALGGIAQAGRSASNWMDQCFDRICDTPDHLPKCKVHGFAVTSLKLMLRYPWYSVDSTSWVITSRVGSVYVPEIRSGVYKYDKMNHKISVSAKSPKQQSAAGQHISHFPENMQKIFMDYFEDKGFPLGRSEFRSESAKYALEDNEFWSGKEQPDGSREVEKRVEIGLCNDYMLRDELNIIYFNDLQDSMPPYPQPFIRKSSKGFGL